jgi:zinc transporter, ZIP family
MFYLVHIYGVYVLLPMIMMSVGGMLGMRYKISNTWYGIVQHFTAGIIFSAVAVELIPALEKVAAPGWLTLGFFAAVILMLVIKTHMPKASLIIPTSIDLMVDGLLVAIGFYTGVAGGIILLMALTMEAFTLGIATMASVRKRYNIGPIKQVSMIVIFCMSIALGFLIGDFLYAFRSNIKIMASILGFGIAALLYLVTEELLIEAHTVKEVPYITACFYIGFFIPLFLGLYHAI